MDYFEVLNDEIIMARFNKIDEKHDSRFSHGKQHAKNTINNVLKLANLLNISEIEKDYLCIACILHDMGQLEGSENHNFRSKIFAEDYLKNKLPNEWLDKVLSAIENHHEKENVDKLSLFEHLVLFADKTDFTFKRIDTVYTNEISEKSFEDNITSVDFAIEDNLFKVVILTNGNIKESDFINWNYYSRILKRIQEFSSKLNRDYKIEII